MGGELRIIISHVSCHLFSKPFRARIGLAFRFQFYFSKDKPLILTVKDINFEDCYGVLERKADDMACLIDYALLT